MAPLRPRLWAERTGRGSPEDEPVLVELQEGGRDRSGARIVQREDLQ